MEHRQKKANAVMLALLNDYCTHLVKHFLNGPLWCMYIKLDDYKTPNDHVSVFLE